jgi:hypothetical protein
MDRIETMGIAQKVGWCFGRTADSGDFGNFMRFYGHLKARLHDCRANAVMTTART